MNSVKYNEVRKIARPRTEEMKERIREAAIMVMSERGFHLTTTDEIAKEANCSVGTIYNYFKNKNDILSYIFLVEKENMEDIFRELEGQTLSVPETIKRFFEIYYDRIISNVRIGKIIFDESNRFTQGLNDEVISWLFLIDGFFQEMLKRGIEEGSVREEINISICAAALMGALNSTAIRGFMAQESLDELRKTVPDALFTMLCEGVFLIK